MTFALNLYIRRNVMSVELNTIINTSAVAPKLTATKDPAGDFASVMQTTQQALTGSNSKSLLTTVEDALANRPNIKAFMDLTGVDFLTASDLIYGVIGSNTDVRNWKSILSDADPVTALRKATGAQYGIVTPDIEPTAKVEATDGGGDSETEDVSNKPVHITPETTVGAKGNFALYQAKEVTPATETTEEVIEIKAQGLKLVDANGMILRDAGETADQIERNAWLFGFDTQDLKVLAEPAKQVSQQLSDEINRLLLKQSSLQSSASINLMLDQIQAVNT